MDRRVPELTEGVLKKECDDAFFDAFSVFRDDSYLKSMHDHEEDEYLEHHGLAGHRQEL
jgi:tRNA(adenine34) deaminase